MCVLIFLTQTIGTEIITQLWLGRHSRRMINPTQMRFLHSGLELTKECQKYTHKNIKLLILITNSNPSRYKNIPNKRPKLVLCMPIHERKFKVILPGNIYRLWMLMKEDIKPEACGRQNMHRAHGKRDENGVVTALLNGNGSSAGDD